MKKIIKSIFIIIAILVVIDFVFGKYFDNMDTIPARFEIGLTDYTMKSVSDDILIFGSSRGRHHYVPSMLEDSLKMSTYNVGRDGYFLSYQCCAIDAVMKRYTPKLIIWEMNTNGLLKEQSDPITALHPYYYQYDMMRETILKKEGEITKYKMHSNIYRYNNVAFIMFIRHILSNEPVKDDMKGYTPLHITIKGNDTIIQKEKLIVDTLDAFKVEIFKKTLEKIKQKNINVLIVDSPIYTIENPERNKLSEQLVKSLCQENDIPYLDYRYMEFFQQSPQLFKDILHLNHDGAIIYTDTIIKKIREYFPNLGN